MNIDKHNLKEVMTENTKLNCIIKNIYYNISLIIWNL